MLNSCDENLQSWFGWLYNYQMNAETPKHLQSQDDIKNILYN